MRCNDCRYVNEYGTCMNRYSRRCGDAVVNEDGCTSFESDNSFDENVGADFDDW